MYKKAAIPKPSQEELANISNRLRLNLSEQELEQYAGPISELLNHYEVVDALPAPTLPVLWPRTAGYQPTSEENKYNAWYYKTDIRGAESGLLAGKTVAVKDCIAVAGVPMMSGSRLLEGYMPEYDATVVTRILNAGGRIKGKSSCNDLCYGGLSSENALGAVLNPCDVTRSAGGSSSGSAALVASGEVDIALGTDQGGSVRLPAAHCGIVGIKPTFGLVSYTGALVLDPCIDTIGPMANTVKDCAIMLQVMAGYDSNDGRQNPDLKVPDYMASLSGELEGVRIGLVEEGFEKCDEPVASLVKDAAYKLLQAEATVTSTSVPQHHIAASIYFALSMEGGHTAMFKNSRLPGFQSMTLTDHITSNQHKMRYTSDSIKVCSLLAQHVQDHFQNHYYAKCQSMVGPLRDHYDNVLKDFDVIIMPTTTSTAPLLPKADTSIADATRLSRSPLNNTSPFNLTGHPALSINAGLVDELPVGMMIVGKRWDETMILRVAHAFECIRDKTS